MQNFSPDAQDGEEIAASGILPPGPEATDEERLQAIVEEAEREKAQFQGLSPACTGRPHQLSQARR